VKECKVERTECLGLKVGDKLERIDERKYRLNTWKEDFWNEKGKQGKIEKLYAGQPPNPRHITEDFPEGLPARPAWAVLRFNDDKTATVAVNIDWQKSWKKVKE